MNLYLRYFDKEVLVSKVEEALDFMNEIPGFEPDDFFVQEFVAYVNSSVQFPKRFKVRNRSYFIVIKTTAQNLEEFKRIGQAAASQNTAKPESPSSRAANSSAHVGWYDATLCFKRVLAHPDTGKFCYLNTDFSARLKAMSVQDCYDRVTNYLRRRDDIDPRSQFPSIKGRNFQAVFLGHDPEESLLDTADEIEDVAY
ncbi:MAG: hypothetical protein ACI3X9_09725 [Bacteroidaceae bacterium]